MAWQTQYMFHSSRIRLWDWKGWWGGHWYANNQRLIGLPKGVELGACWLFKSSEFRALVTAHWRSSTHLKRSWCLLMQLQEYCSKHCTDRNLQGSDRSQSQFCNAACRKKDLICENNHSVFILPDICSWLRTTWKGVCFLVGFCPSAKENLLLK